MSVRRRGNGLNADSYVLLVDVDPRLADPLLVALASAGVAAYTTPATGRTGPFLDLHLPTRPLEAVHVDSTRRPDARRVLEATMPEATVGLPTVEEEDQFAALVAGWDDEPDVRDWPSAEDVELPRRPQTPDDLDGLPRRRRSDPARPSPATPPTPPLGDDAGDGAGADPGDGAGADPGPDADAGAGQPVDLSKPRDTTDTPEPGNATAKPPAGKDATRSTPPGAEPGGEADPDAGPSADADSDAAADLDDEGYTPPRLGAMPPAHPITKWGLVALGLGLILLIFPMVLGLEHTTGVDVAGVLAILGGVGLLVSRLSDRSTDDYEGPDDGAVV